MMKSAFLSLGLLLAGSAPCPADDLSGPGHSTLKQASWGSIFYSPAAAGSHAVEVNGDDVLIKSGRGVVKVLGSDVNGYRLVAGSDLLTIQLVNSDIEIRWREKAWTFRSQNGNCTLTSSAPRDTVVFERNANTFTIKGSAGFLAVTSGPGLLSINSSAGQATVKTGLGSRTFSGVPMDRLPYLGRGVFISFHGVGILLDVARLFPMQEVAEWREWKPIVGQPFDPSQP